MTDKAPRKAWTHEELVASVETYIIIREAIYRDIKINRKAEYRRLAERFGRSAGSFEYRMLNISYVYSLMGYDWTPGFKPASNVGAGMIQTITDIIKEID